ncbi:hypothetical protein ACOSQ2_026439 [Xanthoceras sorbifolium]
MEKYSGKRNRVAMDLNQSLEISPSTPSPQVNKLVPMRGPFMLPQLHQAAKECEFFREKDEEEARNSEFMQTQWMHLKLFWNQRMFEINHTSEVAFKNSHPLPLAKIKRIMKSNEAVKMVSAEAPVLFAKACEIFIMELTARAWMQTVGCNRRTLQRFDIAKALQLDKLFHFLFDAVPDLEKCRKDEEDKNDYEEIQIHPANRMDFLGIDINENVAIAPLDLMLKPSSAFEVNHESTSQTPEEIPQAPMIKPSYSASKFNGGSTSSWGREWAWQ